MFSPKRVISDPGLYIGILTMNEQRILGLDFKDIATINPIQTGEKVEMGFTINELPLLAGQYQLEVHLKDMSHNIFDVVSRRFTFQVVESPVYGGRELNHWFGCIGVHPKPLEIRY
jgi:hypothetical protein